MTVDPADQPFGPRFAAALTFACELHAGQRRKGTRIPYVSHVLGVAALVLEDGGSEDEAIAALLHDAVEDCGGDAVREAIMRRFGEGVAQMVDGCTDATTSPKPEWRERKERFVAGLGEASASVRRIVTADKLHNARALLRDYRQKGEPLWQRFDGEREGTLWYYRQVCDVLARSTDPSALVSELERAVAELEASTAMRP